MKNQPPGRRFGRVFAVLAGAALMLNGLQYLALLALGTPARAHIEYAVSAGGARNPAYRVHYEFDAGGRAFGGTATLGSAGRPSGSLPVRYLPFWPDVSYYDSAGLQAAYGFLSFLPGAALLFVALRRR